jgi:A/G-specific adenine glycosylase
MYLSSQNISDFQNTILQKGRELYRDMPWRTNPNEYYVLLSEIMLQQTQVARVLIKFEEFIQAFPTIENLAAVDFYEVLQHWSGLGYNRRARFLHQTAQAIVAKGQFPRTVEELVQLPGIGVNTAASILVYAFNQAEVFVETNVRTVFIYTFMAHETEKISEVTLRSLVQQTLYTKNPREWYWALMDYGTQLKKTEGNFNRLSKMHTSQSKFEGSNRQKRAQILRLLLKEGVCTQDFIAHSLHISEQLAAELLAALLKDNMVQLLDNEKWTIKN